jgi:hypothetical protein
MQPFSTLFADNKLLHALNKCEPEVLRAMPDPTLPNTDYRTISTLSDLCDKELVATIGWAKQIPGETFISFIWRLCVQKRLANGLILKTGINFNRQDKKS